MPSQDHSNDPGLPPGAALAREREEQRRWRVRPGFAQASWFNSLVESEFLSEEEVRAWQGNTLTDLVDLAARAVPYYREMFDRLGLRPEDIRDPGDLVRLPILPRGEVTRHMDALRLPDDQTDEPGVICTSSSGSTGDPVQVVHTQSSMILTRLLHQRQLRWFRIDPTATMAWIRIPKDLQRRDGQPLPPGDTLHASAWPRIGSFVETGPFVAFSKSNSTEAKVDWLERHRPGYLQAASAQLEHLALAFQERPRLDGLRGLWAAGEPLTPGMRRRIEEVFHVPVHIAYGLDELGWVAVMCSEGRYHVHPERAIVEIVDDTGQPCRPGTRGHLLVTLLGNPAMPLLRYDTGDLAEPVEGRCPCGRTLPVVRAIHGRQEDVIVTPDGRVVTALYNLWQDVSAVEFGQVERDGADHLTAFVVPGPDYGLADERRLAYLLAQSLGPSMRFDIRHITRDAIRRTANGKVRLVIGGVSPLQAAGLGDGNA